ncbi:uncharacterized protein LOC127508877 [Ctenopharyngodon idella]|uniref:uncharacterized protein LOC127508877 n=1 Tax=Ctenopharyngodon idella TaxID=7959 RepID=UPI00222F1D7B|nr:uncharacterized protein LOC127508877 [Ctenopharyngodon idella]
MLPTKPLKTTSALVGKVYSASGQAAACLHTMVIMQAYQTNLLKDTDEWSVTSGARLLRVVPSREKQSSPHYTVLHIIEKGYRILFGFRPPRFNGVLSTVVDPEQSLVLEREVLTLLRKGAIERVPPPSKLSGFYSHYFIVPKKDGGLRSILDLCCLNRTVQKLKFKMLKLKRIVSQVRYEDWFQSQGCVLSCIHPSIHPQQISEVCFRGRSISILVTSLRPRIITMHFHEMDAALAPLRLQGIRVLNYIDDWLILAQSKLMAVHNRDVVLAHMRKLGLRLNTKNSVPLFCPWFGIRRRCRLIFLLLVLHRFSQL